MHTINGGASFGWDVKLEDPCAKITAYRRTLDIVRVGKKTRYSREQHPAPMPTDKQIESSADRLLFKNIIGTSLSFI